ncbi:hypothetical protein Mal52_38710 [Symmachiella dynata]|uniref:Uncharacterized protein n=2 Tax=Symmachiella dynata TaxID=2527995 RepID=A0A517ZSB3_9PLAN|nr:hypothetical protein Mal52_38710 [Symmachiella dynata]
MFDPWIALAWVSGVMLLLFSVSMWEKHPIIAYGPPLEGKFPQGRSYLVAARTDAVECGLRELSLHKHTRFDIVVAFWFSPDRDFLVSCGHGKVAGATTKQTWIHSRLQNGDVLVTTDGFDEGDPSGLYKTKRVVKVRLAKLIAAHRKRLDTQVDMVLPFEESTGDEAALNIQRERAERLIEKGRARWVDDEETVWRYTISGSTHVCLGWFGQLWAGMTQWWRV